MLRVLVSKQWAQLWDTPNRCTPMHSTRLLHCLPTSRLVLLVTPRFTFRKKPMFAVQSTRGLVRTTSKASPTTLHIAHGSTSKKLKSSAVWQKQSKAVFQRCVSKRLQLAPRLASTVETRQSSVSTSIASKRKTQLTSSQLTTPQLESSRYRGCRS